ncbi:hypothetical protein XELAEV_18037319mg [Xenopus laevis]|nr:hypothetical protein XELAEV_18037319mg [Xenopus laevis]
MPHTACCTVTDDRYICRCNVFEIDTPVCGIDGASNADTPEQDFKTIASATPDDTIRKVGPDAEPLSQRDALNTTEVKCPVQLTKWRTPTVKVTYNKDGQYCVVTNYRKYLYGGRSCPVPTPNFCFTPHENTIMGTTVIMPVPVYDEVHLIDSEPDNDPANYVPIFNVHMDPLSINLERLLDRKDKHLVQISNSIEKADLTLDEMLQDGDFQIATTNSWIEIGLKSLLLAQTGLLVIFINMVIVLWSLIKNHRQQLKILLEERHKQLLV